jgi:hypothetical protein
MLRTLARALVTCAAFGGGVVGCADIWGFEDAVALRDGGMGQATDGACPCLPVPAGWQGPLEIFEGSGAADAPGPSCGANYPTDVYEGFATPSAAAAACSCSCGAPEGACGSLVATFFKDGMCMQSCGVPPQTIGSTCSGLLVGNDCKGGGTHFTLESASPVAPGSCAPVSAQSLVPPTWATRVHLCAPARESSCSTDGACGMESDLGFEAETRCIAREGTWSCPSSFPDLHTYYASTTDTRACTPCTCGAPTGGQCENAPVTLFPATACMAAGSTMAMTSGCLPLQGMVSAQVSATAISAGRCEPAGGQPSGTIMPAAPTTVCCTAP